MQHSGGICYGLELDETEAARHASLPVHDEAHLCDRRVRAHVVVQGFLTACRVVAYASSIGINLGFASVLQG